MEVTKIAIKLFAVEPSPPLHAFVPVFHRWIQSHAVEDHLLIDVADYAHVAAGPGVVLVASEANFYFDLTANRPGLLYTRKTPLLGSFADKLRAATAACLRAAALLEQEPSLAGKLRFNTNELLVRLNDRLLAPNTDATFAQVKPAIEALARDLYADSPFNLERPGPSANLFEVLIKSSANLSTADLLDRLHAHAG